MRMVTAAIIINDKKVLVARRAPSEKLAGFWEFPGGKIEGGETPEECLRRELQEEMSIEAKINRLFTQSQFDYEHGSFLILAYIAEIIGGQIQKSVHDEVEWTDKEHLLSYNLLPADIIIAKKVIEELL